MEASYLVIKVKHGDMLRRFNARIVDDKLDLCMDGLRNKIISLFSFPPDSKLMLTYIDEDEDIVTIADDDDLRDVVDQDLNPLRITVKLIDEEIDTQKKHCNANSTPQVEQPQQTLNSGAPEDLKNVPEPLRDTLMKLSADLASKASSSSPVITEIVDVLSSVFSSYLGQLSAAPPEKRSATEDVVSESSKASTKTTDLVDPDLTTAIKALLKIASKEKHPISMQNMEKLKPEESVETNAEKTDNVTEDSSKVSPSKAFNYSAVAAALNTPDVEDSTLIHHTKSNLIPGVVEEEKIRREKLQKMLQRKMPWYHSLAPNPVPGAKKHVHAEKSDETLASYLQRASNRSLLNEKQIAMREDPKLVPNPVGGSASDSLGRQYPINHVKSSYPGLFVKSANPFQTSDAVGSNIPKFPSGPIAKNGSSFPATSVQNMSAVPPQPLPAVRNAGLRDGTGHIVHLGVCCDGCELHPITGPRFKSKVMVNYDLCKACFQEIGNDTDYIRIDYPISYPYQMSFKDLNDSASNVVDSKIPEFPSGPMPKNTNLFSNTSGQNLLPFPPRPDYLNANGHVIHRGVTCDGCGLYPITGPRFKSKVKMDFDLCCTCFQKTGSIHDYVRHDLPFHAMGGDPTLPTVKPAESKLDSRFVQDVNLSDGTVMAPLVPFTKIWRMRNSGTVAWPQKTQLVWVGGDKLSNVVSVEVPANGLMIDQEVDVAVNFITPELPGRYISYWRLSSPSGQKFGQRVWVLIQVDASVSKTPQDGLRGFNLNLPPPLSSFLSSPEMANISVQDMKIESNNSKPPQKIVEPESGLQQNLDNELKFPINDSLLVGNGASTSSVSYPIVDLSYLTPPPPYFAPQPIDNLQPQAPAAETQPNSLNEYQEDALMQLEEMGFKDVELNKEVLALTGYDVEQAVDVLSG